MFCAVIITFIKTGEIRNMKHDNEHVEQNKLAKGVATSLVIVFILAIFVWTLDPNTRSHVFSYVSGETKYISVNGENLLSAQQIASVLESRGINFRYYSDALIVQFLKNFREVSDLINKKVLLEYSKDIGLVMSPTAKQSYALDLYKKAKTEYELRNNIRFNVPFENFFELAEEQYLTSLAISSLTQGVLISKAEAELKYMLEGNRRQVEYAMYDYEDYLKLQQVSKEDLKSFYTTQEASSFRSNIRNRFKAITISGNDKNAMEKLLKSLNAGREVFEKIAKAQNVSAQDYTITPFTKELLPVRQVGVGKLSKLIKRGNMYYIFKPVKIYERKFEELGAEGIAELNKTYLASPAARNKYLSGFQTKVKALFKELEQTVLRGGNFKAEALRKGFTFGMTEYFPIGLKDSVESDVHDPVQNTERKPIKIFTSSNKSFFETVFKLKKGQTSTMLNSGFTYYMVRLAEIKKPEPIEAPDYKRYIVALKKRMQDEMSSKILRNLHTKYKVKWHTKNIIRLVRSLQGRAG
jgi:parvulin-like peptidyl-prolyl isomerase